MQLAEKIFEAKSVNTKVCSAECKKIYRPITYLTCCHCKKSFAADRLNRRFCSKECWYKSKNYTVLHRHVMSKKANRACRQLRYKINKGEIIRPSKCEQCGKESKIEAAHYNYDEPYRVRWLCRSCHAKWDKQEPKGGTTVIEK